MGSKINSGFAISNYHDTEEIYARIELLINQDIRPIKRDEMEKYLKAFDEKYSSSKPVIEKGIYGCQPGAVQPGKQVRKILV